MALCPNVFSTGSGPKPSHYVLLSFGGGTTIRCGRICQLFLTVAYWRSGGGPPKDSNSEPLIKSQGQRRADPNIDKKPQIFSRLTSFFFYNERCIFCPRSGTKQAQPRVA